MLAPFIPDASAAILAAVGAPGQRRELGQRRAGPAGRPAHRRSSTARSSRASTSRLRDRHPHARHSCEDDAGARCSREHARPASGGSSRSARRRERDGRGRGAGGGPPDVCTTAGLHPHHAADWSDAIARRDPRAGRRTRAGGDRRDRARLVPRPRAARGPDRRAFRAQLAHRPRARRCRWSSTAATPTDDCFALLAAEAPPTVVLHCFAATERLDEAVERGWFCSFAGNVTYGSAVDLQDAARRVPDELLLLETDAPYLAPVPHRGRPNEPAYVMDTLRFVAGLRGVGAGTPRRPRRVERRPRVQPGVTAPRQITLARLAELGITPDTRLGQHFLVDDNLVRVALRLAALQPDDVVLEVGPGLGVLTAALADAVASRARDRARPAPRAGAGDHPRRPHQRHGALRGRARRRPGVARSPHRRRSSRTSRTTSRRR